MTVTFNNIPSGLRVPFFYVELDNSKANSFSQNQRALLIGQKTTAGTAVAIVRRVKGKAKPVIVFEPAVSTS